jgi:hypothetical protein
MKSTLLWDLADLFQREARDAEIAGDEDECDRLDDIAGDLGSRALLTEEEERANVDTRAA